MAIKRGTPTARRQARNYTGNQADKRLREVVTQIQQQSTNALMVDSFEIRYYQQHKSTTICTCKQTTLQSSIAAQIAPPENNVPVTLSRNDSEPLKSIKIDYNRQLFGTANQMTRQETNDADDDGADVDDFDFDEDDEENDSHTPMDTVDAPFASGKDCGICYKSGYVPGYQAYGFERRLLTTHNIADVYGFTIDYTTAPHTLRCNDPIEGYADFEVEVPKYFKSIQFSIRDNIHVLGGDSLFVASDDQSVRIPLTTNDFRMNAGRTMKVRVRASEFTHAVIEFDLGTERLHANLAQMSKTVDWTLFDTLGNIQMVLPPTIQNISGSDVIHVPSRSMSFKVTDVTYLRTAMEKNLDWPVSTRVLQPNESLGRIHKAFKLY